MHVSYPDVHRLKVKLVPVYIWVRVCSMASAFGFADHVIIIMLQDQAIDHHYRIA